MNRPSIFLLTILLLTLPRLAMAWSATGHHIISVLAFESLSEYEQDEVFRILKAHPDFDRLFGAPNNLKDDAIRRWQVGNAGTWANVIRGTVQDRLKWQH